MTQNYVFSNFKNYKILSLQNAGTNSFRKLRVQRYFYIQKISKSNEKQPKIAISNLNALKNDKKSSLGKSYQKFMVVVVVFVLTPKIVVL